MSEPTRLWWVLAVKAAKGLVLLVLVLGVLWACLVVGSVAGHGG